MSYAPRQWVALPDFLLRENKLIKYQDLLTYITIRSYADNYTLTCFPSYQTLCDKSGLKRTFLINSIQRLKISGLLSYKATKSATDKNRSNLYKLTKTYGFEPVPLDFFDINDLTYTEKAMLLAIRQCFIHGALETVYTIPQMADYIGVGYKTLYTQFVKLEEKGYVRLLEEIPKKRKRCYELTDRVHWIYGIWYIKPKQQTKVLFKLR